MHPRRLLALALLLSAALALALTGTSPAAAGAATGSTAAVATTAGAAAAPPGAAVAARPRPAWDWPLDGPHPVARPYRAPPTPYGAGHRGIDLPAAAGTPVRSPDDGVVHFAGMVGDRSVLSIRHAGGILSSFEPVDALVAEGRPVRRGEIVGTVALAAGHCRDGCLHLGARLEGRYFSPLVPLGGVPRAVLLPLEPPDGQARG